MPRFLRFHCPEMPSRAGAVAELPDSEARHAVTVLRKPNGAEITLFDGQGLSAPARVVSTGKKSVQAELITDAFQADPPPELRIGLAVPKSGLEDVLPMLAELGVTELVLLDCAYGDVTYREAHGERYHRLAVAAAKQCGSDWLIRVSQPLPLLEALKLPDVVICDPYGEPDLHLPGAPLILIGPEGGWSDAETDASAHLPCWKLPGHVLRTGTAAIVAAALVQDRRLRQ